MKRLGSPSDLVLPAALAQMGGGGGTAAGKPDAFGRMLQTLREAWTMAVCAKYLTPQGGGSGSEAKKEFVYRQSASNGLFYKFPFFSPRKSFLMWVEGSATAGQGPKSERERESNGRFQSPECPRHRHFQPLVQ